MLQKSLHSHYNTPCIKYSYPEKIPLNQQKTTSSLFNPPKKLEKSETHFHQKQHNSDN